MRLNSKECRRRWKKSCAKRNDDVLSLLTNAFSSTFAEEIIYEAYEEGCINWNVLQTALLRIKSHRNGTWMFEPPKTKTSMKNKKKEQS
jgi:hypothetical protein